MLDYKIVLGILATIVGLIGYIPYFRDIFRGKTKPHVFSWFAWSLLGGIDFVAQAVKGGGAGSWVTGFTAAVCFCVAILALTRGEKDITKTDWLCFVAALIGIVLWVTTQNPLLAVVIVTITDAVAFIPTYRKSYYKPHEETLVEYGLAATKWVIGLAALQSLTVTTWLYPASLVLTNGAFVVMTALRRKTLAK